MPTVELAMLIEPPCCKLSQSPSLGLPSSPVPATTSPVIKFERLKPIPLVVYQFISSNGCPSNPTMFPFTVNLPPPPFAPSIVIPFLAT